MLFYRPLVTQLAPPKIPEGERVDFDVCSLDIVNIKQLYNYSPKHCIK